MGLPFCWGIMPFSTIENTLANKNVARVILYDSNGTEVDTASLSELGFTSLGELKVALDETHNNSVYSLLTGILKEMKIMNLHMSMLTDNYITKQEVE